MESLFNRLQTSWLETLSATAYCNPFPRERIELERRLLGDRFIEQDAEWNLSGQREGDGGSNVQQIVEEAARLIADAGPRIRGKSRPSPREFELYRDAALFVLYHQFAGDFIARIDPHNPRTRKDFAFFREFSRQFDRWFCVDSLRPPAERSAAHYFACFFQIHRAFHHIFHHIRGRSPAAAKLRARVWESIFTANMRRYQRSLFDKLGEHPTLVTGPSGTGKELVAHAIGLSRFIPFDPAALKFTHEFQTSVIPINLSAFSPTLIESELFGHRKGAFTGAIQDRVGWLEACGPLDTVFLDEIGDVDPTIQVKLLRVLETREFHRLGETEAHQFSGRIIAATNRDLADAIAEGAFRQDFYFRLCSDVIETPGLKERFDECPAEMQGLARFLALRIVGPEEADQIAAEAVDWIRKNLGADYPWPGNVREFEQCLRNLLMHGYYRPLLQPSAMGPTSAPAKAERETAHQILRKYCLRLYEETGSYEATARIAGLDRRTVKKYMELP